MKIHFLFDTETTDLIKNILRPIHKQPYIIEFYGMLMEEKRGKLIKVDEFETYIDPKFPISKEVTKITGITDEDVKGAPSFKDVAANIALITQRANTVVAHNLSYDLSVTDFEYTRNALATILWPPIRCCTVEATEHFKGHRLSLTALHEYLFGEAFPKAHRARNDVEAMGRCYVELKRRGVV